MYLRGRLIFDLKDPKTELIPPGSFFGGIANLLTGGSWQLQEVIEAYRPLSFEQSVKRSLQEIGVSHVVRITIDEEVIYENKRHLSGNFEVAMQMLEDKLSRSCAPNVRSAFDLAMKCNDGMLYHLIDLDFALVHHVGVDPVAMTVRSVPDDLRREDVEDDASYHQRIHVYFQDQGSFDAAWARWRGQFEAFLTRIADHLRSHVGVEQVHTDIRTVLPRSRYAEALKTGTSCGYPLYGFDPARDLAHLLIWDSLWSQYKFCVQDVYWGDPGDPYLYIGDRGWSREDASRYESLHPAIRESIPAGMSDDALCD